MAETRVTCGEFYQVPPVQTKHLFKCDKENTSEALIIVDLWLNFK